MGAHLNAAELADHLAAQHERWFADHPTSDLVQTVMFEQENGETHFIACPWKDADERAFVLNGLRIIMRARKVVRYAVWAEVWIKNMRVPKGADAKAEARKWGRTYQHGDIAQEPDRGEAVFTLVVEGGGKVTGRLQRIERGRNGGVRRLVMEEMSEGGFEGMGGALADLMPERSVH